MQLTKVNELLTADCYPITVTPGLSQLFVNYCAGDAAARAFYASVPLDGSWPAVAGAAPVPSHWPELVRLLAEQNSAPSPAAAAALAALGQGAGTVVTGQQVTLFGGPLFTPFKAATALARARQATAAGHTHAAVFWLATEDHDFAEINHVSFPAGRELRKLVYSPGELGTVGAARPVGGMVLDDRITALVDRRGSCWASPTRQKRWPRLTNRAIPLPRLSGGSTPGSLPSRGCWCWTRRAVSFIAWVRRCCARRWSAPTSCTRR